MLIGITGPQGSGKSSVSEYLGEILEIEVVHGDELAHEILTIDLYNECLSWFNLPKEDKVDRKKIGNLIFTPGNEELKKKFNKLIYDIFLVKINEILSDGKSQIIDWNFLPITTLFARCDFNILVTAPVEERLRRVMKRDNISYEYALSREKSALKYDDSAYNIVLNNYQVTLEELTDGVKKILCK